MDAEVDVSDLEEWERLYGRIPDGAIVIMYSGHGAKYSNDFASYMGFPENTTFQKAKEMMDKDPLSTKLHFPGFSAAAAGWLMDKRNG